MRAASLRGHGLRGLDRIGRKLSDIAELHDRLQFLGIPLHAVKLGEVTTLHVGLMGTMAQLYLADLADKTKRGQLGRALAGKIPGGQAYGYALVDGQSGERRIKSDEAMVVERIFREFAAGKIAAGDRPRPEQSRRPWSGRSRMA